ncbi:MAG: (2Fe-2S)-binding protein [Gammaproteobacteria bacterium]|nr:(2Fe-2S)-binding protein [Gammaproteobacteria bacterium]MDH3410954.1 (2Fe-2S)-binding protein [Gammaproteobacteria bacterium]
MPDIRTITVTINGKSFTRRVETRMHLADFLRQELDLTGTHLGCEHGVCGACTVMLEGDAVRSCLLLAVQADSKTVTTVEGLAANDGSLHPIQAAFQKHHGLQCGFCTPGMLISLVSFLRDHKNPDEGAIREAISGNLCRCTGYQPIVDAALEAAAACYTQHEE